MALVVGGGELHRGFSYFGQTGSASGLLPLSCFSSSARRCAALGPAWMLERRLLPPPCCVEVLRCRLWSLGRYGRRLVGSAASGPACCVLCCIGFRPVFL